MTLLIAGVILCLTAPALPFLSFALFGDECPEWLIAPITPILAVCAGMVLTTCGVVAVVS